MCGCWSPTDELGAAKVIYRRSTFSGCSRRLGRLSRPMIALDKHRLPQNYSHILTIVLGALFHLFALRLTDENAYRRTGGLGAVRAVMGRPLPFPVSPAVATIVGESHTQ